MPRQEQVIWAAGFFDGEGCISIAVKTRKNGLTEHSLNVSAMQKIREPLVILHELFGGSIHVFSKRYGGWVWRAGGSSCVRALEEMVPYLVVKKEQTELALVFQSRKVKIGAKYADPVKARALDQRDWREMRALKVVA